MILSALSQHKPTSQWKGQAFSVAFLLSCSLFSFQALAQSSENSKTETDTSAVSDTGLSNAAESLSKIIRDAKRSGLVQSRSQSTTQSPDTPQPSAKTSTEALKVSTTQVQFNVAGCDAASVLDFSDMKSVSQYNDILSTQEKYADLDPDSRAIQKARTYLSLAMGVEAKAVLGNLQSEEARLLRHAAAILEIPNTAPQSAFFLPYSECGEDVFFWATLDMPSVLQAEISGQDRRRIISKLDNYPPRLKDFFAVHFAIRALENDRFNVGNGIWNKLEREARETQSSLPSDRFDEDELLYLKGLLERDADTDFALSIFSYLAEREGLYRLAALQELTALNLENKAGEAAITESLIELSEKSGSSLDSRIAAFELVKNRVHAGEAEAAIEVVRKYFEPSDERYIAGAEKIRNIVEAKLINENKLVRLQGLNAFLMDKGFYAVTEKFAEMEVLALNAAFESGLPELHTKILSDGQNLPTEAKSLFRAAQLFAGLKSGEMSDATVKEKLEYLDHEKIFHIGRFAVSERKIELAQHIAGRLTDEAHKAEINRSLAVVGKRWDSLPTLPPNSEQAASQEKMLAVVTQTIQPAVTTKSPQWFSALPAQLDKIETSIRQTEDYLKNG